MAKTIQMRTPQQEKEARLVAGMYDKNRKIQSELYAYCSKYFWANYRGVFFADEESATEIWLIEHGQNLDNIKEIATATGGVFIQVCNETQLSEAIQQIQNAISFEKRPLKKPAKMFKPDRGMLVKLFKEIYDVSKIPL